MATRLSIDQLRSARARREQYVGEWLPEPLVTDGPFEDVAGHAEEADSLSMAFLLVLERLSPVERAVFLLHDVFDYGYDEVARIVDKTEENCRQLAVRARRHVTEMKPRFEASRRQREELAERFFGAVEDGDMDDLVELLSADVVVVGDNGGTKPAWPRPIVGRDRVAKLLAGMGRQSRDMDVTVRRAEINGQPGAEFLDSAGRLMYIITLDIADGAVQTVRSVINPDEAPPPRPARQRARDAARPRRAAPVTAQPGPAQSSSNRSSTTSSSSVTSAPCDAKNSMCAWRQWARLRSPSASVQANSSSTSPNRRVSTSVMRITHSGAPAPSRMTLRSPTAGNCSPGSYADARLAVARFGPSRTSRPSSVSISGSDPKPQAV